MNYQDCKKDFTKNILNKWFDGNNEIKAYYLAESISLDDAQQILDNPICGVCEPETKAKLEKISQLNKESKKKININ